MRNIYLVLLDIHHIYICIIPKFWDMLEGGNYIFIPFSKLVGSIEEFYILIRSNCSAGIALIGLNFGAGGGAGATSSLFSSIIGSILTEGY